MLTIIGLGIATIFTLTMWYLMFRTAKAFDEFRKAARLYIMIKRKQYELEQIILDAMQRKARGSK